jgi:hypothetical protein
MKGDANDTLPPSWAWSTIGAVVEHKVQQCGPARVQEFTYIDISSIDNRAKRIVSPKLLRRSDAPSRARQALSGDDVLVSMTRPNLNAVAMVPQSLGSSIGSTGFDVLRAKAIEPGWLFYAVQTNDFIDAMCRVVQGALYPAVRPKDVRSYRLPIAPLDEQRRIVAKLDELLSDLDAGVAALERARANLKRYRASVLKAAVEGRLTESWRAAHRPVETGEQLLKRILTERRRKWEQDQLAAITAAGKAPPKNWQSRYKEPAGPDTKFLPMLPASFVEIAANVGASRQHMVSRARTTAGQTGISGQDVREMPIPLPPAAEQSQVVAEVNERLSQTGVAELSIANGMSRATRLRRSILRSAFEGKLVAQDPADEPATVLLARIAQSRLTATNVRTKGKQHSDEFLRRAAIVSYTVKRLAAQPSFGRTQLEKTLHLAQSHLGIDLGLEFERYAAGPFDKSIYRLEGTANKSGWFTKKNRLRTGVTYHPGPKIDSMCEHALRLLGDKQPPTKPSFFSTAYAAWNDLLIDGRPADDKSILAEIYGWHESKKRFTRTDILKRLEWMRRNGYVPSGQGQKTEPMKVGAKVVRRRK